jgi:Uma2 family endonuclease
MVLAPKLATYEDLEKLPEGVRAEVIDGVVCMTPSPRPRHGLAAIELGRQLAGAFGPSGKGPGGWWLLSEIDVRLERHQILRPDLSGWLRTSLPKLPDRVPIDTRPDWVCEVLSPSNKRLDRVKKMAVYAHNGIPHVWLVDPDERTLEAYELTGPHWTRLGAWTDGDVVEIAPFLGLQLDVAGLFEPQEPEAEPTLDPA